MNQEKHDVTQPANTARKTYQDITNTLSEVVVEMDASGKVLFINDKGKDVFGVRQADITKGLAYHELCPNTQLEEAKARTLELAAIAHAADRSKTQFLANVSHEIRTPLNGIIGMTELMQETTLTTQQYEYLNMLHGCSHVLLTLINDLLDFSKIESGKFVLDKLEFDPRQTIEESIQLMAVKAHEKGLTLLCDIACELPSTALGDANRLRQILLNLIENAINFTEQGMIQISVNQMTERITPGNEVDSRVIRYQPKPAKRVRECSAVHETDLSLHIIVKDTGIGIDADKQDLIFDAFTQADGSISSEYGGTGLGLTICRELVHAMNGSIWVVSEPGQGSTFHFTVRFPLPQKPTEPVKSFSPLQIKGARVLIIDENINNLTLVANYLSRWNLYPDTAETMLEGIHKIEQAKEQAKPYALIIAYAHMPEMEADALAASLQKNNTSTCPLLVMLPPVEMDATRRQLMAQHVAGTITMPIVPSRLLSAVIRTIHPPSPSETVTPEQTDKTTHSSVEPLRILIVEDNDVNLKLAIYTLESMGQHVLTATNGEEAVKLFESETFDAILMDVQMPVMDGWKATKLIRKIEQEKGGHIPIAALTAHAMRGDKDRCLQMGMDTYIPKPLKRKELLAFIKNVRNKTHDKIKPPEEDTGTTQEPALFDKQELLVRLGGDKRFMGDLIAIFIQHTPEQLDKLQTLLDGNNMKDAQRMAHTIKGGAANISAQIFRDCALEIELLCADQKQKEALLALQALNKAYEDLQKQLKQCIDEL